MSYEIKLEKFSGPLEKLLALIEEKHLGINEVSLAAVTGDFLNYVSSLEGKIEMLFFADFLVIGAKLVLL